jgi:biotin carboxyl carrier protein
MNFEVAVENKVLKLELARTESGWHCTVDGEPVNVDAVLTRPNVISIIIDGVAYEVKREIGANDQYVWVHSARFKTEVRDPRSLRSRRASATTGEGPQKLLAPMPGKVVRVIVKEGDSVEAGKGILVVEAMKMQNELKATKTGTVQKILVAEGANVNAGDVLAIVE